MALAHARRLGATDAAAEASEGCGLSVSVRKGELENVERNRDKGLSVTVYVGSAAAMPAPPIFRRGIAQTVQAAYDIARFTAEDPMASLPDEADIAPNRPRALTWTCSTPGRITSEQAAALALRCEKAALATRQAHHATAKAPAVSAQQSHFFSAHTHGFRGGYASSRHSMSVSPIAGKGDDMQRDSLVQLHAQRAGSGQPAARGPLRRRAGAEPAGRTQDLHRQCPVLFESPLAAGLLGSLVQALSGGALYRKSSFLLNSLGKQVLPKHIDMCRRPVREARQGQLAV
jgi:PmbA protein